MVLACELVTSFQTVRQPETFSLGWIANLFEGVYIEPKVTLLIEDSMGRCLNHPDVETSYHCTKYDLYLCADCLECRDPDIYCKFRTSCPIAFISKDQGRLDAEQD
jgi:hypothetical protein